MVGRRVHGREPRDLAGARRRRRRPGPTTGGGGPGDRARGRDRGRPLRAVAVGVHPDRDRDRRRHRARPVALPLRAAHRAPLRADRAAPHHALAYDHRGPQPLLRLRPRARAGHHDHLAVLPPPQRLPEGPQHPRPHDGRVPGDPVDPGGPAPLPARPRLRRHRAALQPVGLRRRRVRPLEPARRDAVGPHRLVDPRRRRRRRGLVEPPALARDRAPGRDVVGGGRHRKPLVDGRHRGGRAARRRGGAHRRRRAGDAGPASATAAAGRRRKRRPDAPPGSGDRRSPVGVSVLRTSLSPRGSR